MKKLISGLASLVLLGSLSVAAARAQSAPAAAKSAEPSGFQKDALNSLADAEKKLVALAGATPQEKYSWRPGEGVRSSGEVFSHVATGNYYYAKFLGIEFPAGLDPRSFDKLTDKDKIIDTMKQSYAQLRSAISGSNDLEKTVKMFGGREMTTREAILLFVTHNHEHLGQSIAYARANGIVPPWTAEREEQQKKSQPAKKP